MLYDGDHHLIDRNLLEYCNSYTNDAGCVCSVIAGTTQITLSNNVMHDCRGNSETSPRTGIESGLTVSCLHIPPRANYVTAVNNTLFRCSFASFKIFQSDNNYGENNCLFGSTYQTALVDINSGLAHDNLIKNNIAISSAATQRTHFETNNDLTEQLVTYDGTYVCSPYELLNVQKANKEYPLSEFIDLANAGVSPRAKNYK